jgi:hypothetical protein
MFPILVVVVHYETMYLGSVLVIFQFHPARFPIYSTELQSHCVWLSANEAVPTYLRHNQVSVAQLVSASDC